MRELVRRRYDALVGAGALRADEQQLVLADRLDMLSRDLGEAARKSKRSALGWLFAKDGRADPVRGLYIWGGVGCGKTLLMDLFFEAVPAVGKRRVHFHAFMGEVHDRIAEFRRRLKSGEIRGDDPIPPVGQAIAEEASLLCFDEFAVNDIADAMILGRLFEQLFVRGVTVVATSNIAPEDLYKHGLNRALFLPFLALLRERMAEFHLGADRDYRLDDPASAPLYSTPLGPRADLPCRALPPSYGSAAWHASTIAAQGPNYRSAGGGRRRCTFQFRGIMYAATRRRRLSEDRCGLPHDYFVRRPGAAAT